MDVDTQTDSGQEADNAGKVDEGLGLDGAIEAALDASNVQDDSMADQLKAAPESLQESESQTEGEAPQSAGDDGDVEKAGEPDNNTLEDDKAGEAQVETEAFQSPKHWPQDRQEAFNALPDEGKSILLKIAKDLEGGFTRKSQELSDKGRFADSIRGLIDDATRQQLQTTGTDEAGYFQYLDRTQKFASTQPVEYVKWAMQNLGVSPDQLGFSSHQAPETQQSVDDIDSLYVDPAVHKLTTELDEVKRNLAERERRDQQARVQSEQDAVHVIQDQIGDFRSTLNDDGQLKYPLFDSVQREMGALMDTNPILAAMPDGPDKLDKAYDMAVWAAQPDYRQSIIEAEASKKVQALEQKAAAERAKKAAAVKPAASIATSRPGSSTLDDAILQASETLGR